MTRPLTIAATLALAALSYAVVAQDAQDASPAAEAAPAAAAAAPAALTGDADTGRQLTYTCIGCHGVEGYRNIYPHYHVPLIGGQSAVYLNNALQEYRKGTRKHPTMQAQAQSFSDQDIADIAAFLSGLQK
ncbi:cytochrome c [Luteimonas aestuarii]|uniref:Cytochrome c n=1 Tax=Luteimonas aestuarii TaxID=453837 RepID=A0A4R5TL96_9GAMM|nr:cytochrome c [Luteimonas aestuarii]TDK23316.1 cytochrome c [Luteimonas aestuarii]